MFQAKIISEDVRDNQKPDKMLSDFIRGIEWVNTKIKAEELCMCFLNIFYEIGGPFTRAAEVIQDQWLNTAKKLAGVTLLLD